MAINVQQRPAARWLVALGVFASCAVAWAEGQARPGKVEFSDGSALVGNISLTPGSELKIHLDNQVRTLAFDRVRELRMEPEKESLEQAYRFPEAGKAFRVAEGKPFPVRSLKTAISLAGGENLSGHLYTTVLYVETGENAKKVILLAKQRGKEGAALKELVYAARISFDEPGAAEGAVARLTLKLPEIRPSSQVVALSVGALDRVEAKPAGGAGEYTLASAPGSELFVAIKNGGRITVGWPRGSDEKMSALVKSSMPNSEDFFDERRVLGVYHDEAKGFVYSLILGLRKGKTTLEEARSQPWRLELYRWKLDDDGARVMLAGKGYFFRGIDAKNETVPVVEVSEKLWHLERQDGGWVAGEERR